MGSPLSLSQSVTRGIVSNTDMVMPQTPGGVLSLLDGEDVGTIVKWIGHDAPIYPGNSGGPLVNLAGEIVGVNEISFGLGGAIPSGLAASVFDAIRRDGRVRRSWTGLELQPRLAGIAGPGGLVAWVAEHSPAADAGVRTGDVLVQVNDTPIDVRFAEQLPAANRALLGLSSVTRRRSCSRATGGSGRCSSRRSTDPWRHRSRPRSARGAWSRRTSRHRRRASWAARRPPVCAC